ncbi:hypothetical protein AVEN_167899-1 [Araneus ventricosus]|uniref:Uncharacterized protein n=1 Tax=Araneus ventricosus TaxID=182803 RepID=A0A4Y2ISJ1_ARAVE|nr:hypothetical protein AVEN_167899-1 [Araneus ventricosus]
MISFATRFQNIGPVQETCAHPCFCDQLTGPWAVWMMVKVSLHVQGDYHCMQFPVFRILYLLNQLVNGVVSGSVLSKTELVVMKLFYMRRRSPFGALPLPSPDDLWCCFLLSVALAALFFVLGVVVFFCILHKPS